MNLDTWNSFPKDIQDQIMSVCGEKIGMQFGPGVYDKAEVDLPGIVKKAGLTMNQYTVPKEEVNKWIDVAGKPVWSNWVKNQTAKGLKNAQAILDDVVAMSKQSAQPSK
jgi:TRAP-type transport system periplasmic protein